MTDLVERILRAVGDAALVTDPAGRIVHANPAALRLLGFARDELIGTEMGRLERGPEAPARWADRMDRLREGGIPPFRATLLAKGARPLPAELTLEPIEADGARRVLVLVRNLAAVDGPGDPSRPSGTLPPLAGLAARLADLLPHPLAYLDPEQRHRYVNAAYAAQHGRERVALLGEGLAAVAGEPVFGQMRPHFLRALAGEACACEIQVPDGHGGVRHLLYQWIPDPDRGPTQGVVAVVTDVTDRVAAEAARRKAESLLAEIQEVGRVGNWDLDLRTGAAVWSDEEYRLLGYEPRSVAAVVENFLEVVHPDDKIAVVQEMERALTPGEPAPYWVEHRVRLPNGGVRRVDERARVTFDTDGTPLRMFGTTRDITDIRDMEAEIASAEAQWLSALDLFDDAVCLLDGEDRFLRANRAFHRLFGSGKSLAQDRLAPCMGHYSDGAGACPVCEARRAGRDTTVTLEADDPLNVTGRPLAVTVKAVTDGPGRSDGVLVGFHDLTAQRAIEDELRRHRDRLEEMVRERTARLEEQARILDRIAPAVIVLDPSDRIREWKGGGERLLGYRADEVVGMPFDLLLSPDEGRPRRLRPDGSPADGREAEVRMVRKDGSTFDASLSLAPNTDAQGNSKGAIVIVSDISQRREMERALLDSESRHRELFTRMTAGVAVLTAVDDGADFLLADINEAGAHIANARSEDIVGQRASSVFPGLGITVVPTLLRKVWVSGESEPTFFTRYRDERRDLYVEGAVYRLPGGEVVAIFNDVSEREQAQDALRESRQRFKNLVESSHDWIWEVDTDGLYTYCSPRSRELLGYDPEDLVGSSPFDLMPLPEAQRVREIFREVVQQRAPVCCLQHVNLHRDGHPVVLETSGVPFFDESGALLGYRGVDRDITLRVQAERELRVSEERFRGVFENAGAGMAMIRENLDLIRVNPAFAVLLGYREADLPGRSLLGLLHPDDRAAARERLQRMDGEAGAERPPMEHRYLRRDGSVGWFLSSVSWEPRTDGRAADGIILVQDVSDRKAAEMALKASEQRYRLLMTEASDPILIMDSDTRRIVEANREAGTLLGRSPAELSGIHQSEVFPEDPWIQFTLTNPCPAGCTCYERREARVLSLGGGLIPVDLTSSAVEHRGRHLMQVILRDLTGHKEQEEKRVAQERQQRTVLVREVHHRIKNNLQGVVLLLRQFITDHPQVTAILEEAILQVQTIAVVHGIQGTHPGAEIHLRGMTEAIVKSARSVTNAAIVLEQGQPSVQDHPLHVLSNETAVSIALVINELIVNAVKHGVALPDGTQALVSLRGEGMEFALEVENGGALAPGFDLDNRIGVGTGLDLATSMLPRKGCRLTLANRGDRVVARLVVGPPVLKPV